MPPAEGRSRMWRELVRMDGGERARRRLRSLAGLFVFTIVVWACTEASGAARNGGGEQAAGSGPAGGPATTTAPPEPPASNVPMEKLAPGEQAPQFVLFSVDGGGWHERWRTFMAAAEPHDARFTAFLTGIYLLSDGARGNYTGPGHSPGRASVGFGGAPADVQTLVDDLNNAWLAGHEVGTHYNGHFCDGNDPSANDWSAAEWDAEIAQFKTFWRNWPALNGITSPRPLRVPLDEVKGGRTPCLEGRWDQLAVAWANAGYRYDTSQVSNGMVWPRVEGNVWEFRMPTVDAPTMGRVIAMDYNFWVKLNGGAGEPARAAEFRRRVLDTYRHMYDAAYNGNRAPLVIGNHFNGWSGNAFNPAVADFMTEVCGKPDTYCATYSDVIAWLELQDPATLAALQARPAVY